MDRDLWTDSVYKLHCPPWPCTACTVGKATLRLSSLQFIETEASRRQHDEDYWGPEDIEYQFIAWADCTNQPCKHAFTMAGLGGIEQQYDPQTDESVWVEWFRPTHVHPAPQMISMPNQCPRDLKDALSAAFSLYWVDAEACAGRIRTAVETLLTHLSVPTSDASDPIKPKRLNLHRRLELLQKSHPEPSVLLMSVKLMGNSGSHGASVTRRDVLDALELLEHVLPELIEGRSSRMRDLAARLARRHQR